MPSRDRISTSESPYSPITRGSRRLARLDLAPSPARPGEVHARRSRGTGAEPFSTIAVLKLFLSLTTLAATLALTVAAAPASAGTPCWKLVISDWYADGR